LPIPPNPALLPYTTLFRSIEGRATGARPGQRIVLYAKTDGRWGVCRQSGQPFTNIETDGGWKASVHLGIQYAALLVDPTYNPPRSEEHTSELQSHLNLVCR